MQTEIHRKDYTPLAWRISEVELTLDIHPEYTEVRSELKLTRLDPAVRCLALHGESLNLQKLVLNGRLLHTGDYRLTETGLEIAVDADQLLLQSVVHIDPAHNTALEGFYASESMLCTQCEPEGFRHITWFLDRPDQMAHFTTTLIADQQQYPVLLANGNKVDSGALNDGRHYACFKDPTLKPSYLFAAVAAKLDVLRDHYVTMSGRTVNLEIYADAADISQCVHAMQSLKAAMRWDEECYGREYDLDTYVIVAVSHFNMGAMENKGLNIFNTACVLADTQLTTDAGFARVESVIAHEYFHNWTGNRVTCRDWFQLCLKEGLTVFRDQQFSADQHSAAVERIDQLVMLKTVQFAEDAGPRSHPVRPSMYREINNFYTATVYEKGAEIVRMLHWVLGETGFRQGMDCYFDRHDGQAVTVEAFIQALSDGSGEDVTGFMPWYEQAGTPVLRLEEWWDADTQRFRLRVIQQSNVVLPIPFRVGFLNTDGTPLAWSSTARWRDDGVLLRERVTEIWVQACTEPPVPVLLKGFSAPVLVQRCWHPREIRVVIVYESDPVSRWLAMQEWWVMVLRQMMAESLPVGVDLVHVAAQVLSEADKDPAWVARMFQLPGFAVVALGQTTVDPHELFAVRRQLMRHLGLALNWQPWLSQVHSVDPGRRALAEVAWSFYAAAQQEKAVAQLLTLYEQAATMTARQACIAPLYYLQGLAASWVRQDWLDRFAQHPLVVDRWFSMQAGHPETTLEQVGKLLQHPQYDWNNPNRVRSVLSAFAQSNPQFHAKNGQGYAVLVQSVLLLDRSNPQLAARLLSLLDSVMLMPTEYQERVRVHIRRGLKSCQSADVMEMRDKWLASAYA